MAQKTKIGKNSTPTIVDPGYIIPMANNLPAEWTKKTRSPKPNNFKLLRVWTALWCNQQRSYVAGCPLFCCLHNWRIFMHFCLHLNDVNISSWPIELISWLKVLLDPIAFQAIIEPLEGLIDFVAFLVQKLWQNIWILNREIPGNPPGFYTPFRVLWP